MKVLHVIDSLGVGGGAEHSLANLLPRLRERGVESSVACLIPRQGGLQERLRREGFPVTVLGPRHLPGRVRVLRSLARRNRPDLVHATLFNSCLVSRLALFGLGIPRVDSLVSMPYDPVRSRQLGVAAWKLQVVRLVDGLSAALFSKHFHAVSDAVAKAATEALGIPPRKIHVVPRGRSVETMGEPGAERRRAVRRSLQIADDVPLLLNVGRQDQEKGQAVLIEALPRILHDHPETTLIIAGREGNASPAIAEAVRRTGSAGAVRFLGHRDDVPDLLVASDVFVFPSLSEGVGGSAIEAMALAVPVVAADLDSMREVVGDCGLLAVPGDPASLGDAVARLLADPGLRRRMGRCGRRRFLDRYTLEAIAEASLRMYEKILGWERSRRRSRHRTSRSGTTKST